MNLRELLSGESKNVEYKLSRPEKSIKYMKTVVAFANGSGGYIVFGVEDKTRLVIGIPEDLIFQEMDAIANAISDSCEPVIVPEIYPQTVHDRVIIVVGISAGRQRPYYIKSDGLEKGTYMRVSGTTRLAGRDNIREMYYTSEGRSYDSVVRTDVKVTDEEIDKLCAEMKQVAIANCKDDIQRRSVKDVTKNVLLSWGILAEGNDGSIHPTNAYIFLSGREAFLSYIQCGMFKGCTRAIFLDKRDYDGPLWEQVENAFQFVLRNIRLGAKIEGVYRKDIYELPPDSVRELIINAVMNCNFIQSSHVQVAIYDNKLEITSPGGLLPGVTIKKMKEGYSQIRNKALAHAFSYMNLIEGWGTGIPRLMREMQEYGLREPEFIDMEIALRINLYRSREFIYTTEEIVTSGEIDEEINGVSFVREGPPADIGRKLIIHTIDELETNKELKKLQKTSEETSEEIEKPQKTGEETGGEIGTGTGGLITPGEKILNEIKENPFITQRQLAGTTGMSYSGVRYVMKQLQKDGILVRVGATKNGKWIINI